MSAATIALADVRGTKDTPSLALDLAARLIFEMDGYSNAGGAE
jgi:hypothetical protein